MMTFDTNEIRDLACVLEYVAEQRDPDEPTNSVVFAALRLIECMKEQLTTEQIAEIDDDLQTTRGFRFDECLWNAARGETYAK
ncbi:MAG: hypothetical protein O3C40_09760 [Planctomycetota bacterium]|nr:hypothetical protein [Planctomycetota bacterium]